MAKFYLYTTIFATILMISWILTFYKDVKNIKVEQKGNTEGQKVALLFKFILLMLCPIINITYSIFLWFYYDNALKSYKKEE